MNPKRFSHLLIAILVAAWPAFVVAQVTEIGGIGNIFEKRSSSKSESKKTKATPTPKASPTPPAPQGQRPQGTPPPGQAGGQKPGQPAQQPPRGQAQGRPAPKQGGGASQGPANTGQLRVVTKGLADSIKTRLVEYDEEALRTSGTAIILSPRRYKAQSEADQSGLSSPLTPATSGL